jgi:hypothetical protein
LNFFKLYLAPTNSLEKLFLHVNTIVSDKHFALSFPSDTPQRNIYLILE